jgi:hypothetical protein
MPAVNPKKLKRLMTLELLLPFALKRKLSAAQLEDLAERAMVDKRFDLSAYSDEFAGYMNADQATDWATEFERVGTAPHLFATEGDDLSKPEEMFGDVPLSEVEEMSAEARLRLANKVADQKRRNDQKH